MSGKVSPVPLWFATRTVTGMVIYLAAVPPLRSPTRPTAAWRKNSGCSGRDGRGGIL
jgi:hypothetical protein